MGISSLSKKAPAWVESRASGFTAPVFEHQKMNAGIEHFENQATGLNFLRGKKTENHMTKHVIRKEHG